MDLVHRSTSNFMHLSFILTAECILFSECKCFDSREMFQSQTNTGVLRLSRRWSNREEN